ncbi:HYR domain-containing protein [Flavobacterium capsici]|uniref:HYR domain-containing protein n=1 Tax=Flavobacterium capsici TaxID=3075618 RepID=A0AA96EXM2_9FLAO|nr:MULTISPECIES: HYR domain-containing protein [unclassified Flavobacterium]WNM20364.1 HYR domain-containing protein [Flavobacterium sp. PMR2A8]WNM21754.1 HYR domain-containing protein [Flavobacterium sp. PMTSA4]
MKTHLKPNRFSILLLGIFYFLLNNYACAQLVSGNAFLQGNYAEVGVSPSGSFGTTVGVPNSSYHPRPGNQLGFVSDPQKDGWNVGTPKYIGDYFIPGLPEEGWGITMNNVSYNNLQLMGDFEIPGSLSNYVSTPQKKSITWQGSINGLSITAETYLPANSLYFVTEVTIVNTTASTINNVYYMRNVDPDQEHPLTGNYSTFNSIVYQNPNTCNRALASATGLTYGSYLGLGSIDSRAKVSRGSFSNRSAARIWNGTGVSQSGSQSGDFAISIAFFLGNLAPNQSTTFSYAYILSTADLNEALAATNINFNINNSSYSTGASANICSGTATPISIVNPGTFTNWSWSPSTGLNTTTGTNVVSTLTTPITYTATGSGPCGSVELTISVNPVVSPTVGNAGPMSGPSSILLGQNNINFSISPVANATNYTWTLPPGAVVTNGANTNSITFNASNISWCGDIVVVPSNDCSTGASSSKFTCLGNQLTCGPINTSLCEGQTFNVNYTSGGIFNPGNIFTAQLSNASGDFSTPTNIGSINSTSLNGTISVTIPMGTPYGTGYRVRIVSSNLVGVGGTNGSDITINNLVTPSVSLTTTSSTICSNENGEFTAILTNEGDNPLITWYLNNLSIEQGSNQNISIGNMNSGDEVYCVLNSNAACPTINSVTSNSIIMDVLNPPVITCPSNIEISNTVGLCGANVSFEATATGTPTPNITYSIPSGSFFPVGITSILVTATNSCGTDTCVFTITVNPTNLIQPEFNPVTSVCYGSPLSALPTTSNNNITGSWSPALDNTQTTTYTFTPNPNQCASTATLTIGINALPTVSISGETIICEGSSTTLTVEQASAEASPGLVTPNIYSTSTSCDCPPEYVVVGIQGSHGAWIDQFRLVCQKLNPNGTLSGPYAYTCYSGVSLGPVADGPYLLPANTVMVGGNADYINPWVNGYYLHSLQGYGQTINNIYNNQNNNSSPSTTTSITGWYAATGNLGDSYVPNGNVVTGMTAYTEGYSSGVKWHYKPISQFVNTYNWSTSETTPSISVATAGPVSVTATDLKGCSNTASTTIVVNALPTITCPANITVSSTPGQCGANVSFEATATGTPTPTLTYSIPSGSFFPVGTTTVTATATNDCDAPTCVFTVTVNDSQPPVITCPEPLTFQCPGEVVLTQPDVSDNCSSIGNSLNFDGSNDHVTLPEFNLGTSDFTIETWINPNSNSSGYLISNRTFEPNQPGNWFVLSRQGAGNIGFEMAASGSPAYLPIISTAVAPLNTWTHLAVSRQGTLVTLYINGVPDITVNDTFVRNLSTGNYSLFGGFPAFNAAWFNGTMDEVRIWDVARTQAQIDANKNLELSAQAGLKAVYNFNQGIPNGNNAGLTNVVDGSGNNYNGLLNNFALSGTNSNWVEGNSAINNLIVSNNAPAEFAYGSNTVTWTATDASGNTTTCEQIVTVNDTEAPSITCPANIVASTDAGQCSALVTFPSTLVLQYDPTGQHISTEEINYSYIATDYSASTLSQVGSNATWTNTNNWPVGQISSSPTPVAGEYLTFQVTVPNGTDLARLQYSKIAYLGGGATFASIRSSLDGFTSDISTIPVAPIGNEELVFNLSSMPFVSGAVTFRIYFYGSPNNKTDWDDLVSTNSGGNGLRLYANNLAVATDNCGPVSITYSNFPSNYIFNLGANTITATADDGHGNTTQCSFTVTVNDNEPPVITCPDTVVANMDPGQCGANVTFAATATDNCGNATITYSPASGSFFALGDTEVTATADDGHGNTSQCTFIVTVNQLDWANLQWPPDATICPGASFTAYGQVYEPNVTPGAGVQGANIEVQFGYSSSNTDPSVWSNWSPASFNSLGGGAANDEYYFDFSSNTPGTYYYTFRYRQNGCTWQYGGFNFGGGGFWDGINNVNGVVTVQSLDWANLQWPPNATICQGSSMTAYGQVYESGVTIGAGVQGAGIDVEFGYSTTNTNPSGWSNWSSATFNPSGGGAWNDEYQYNFTPPSSGTYYYTFRYRLNGCLWQYGGYSPGGGNFWDGANFVNGSVTVDPTSVGGTVSGGTSICPGETSALLTLSGHVGNVVRWESAVAPYLTWTPTTVTVTATSYTSGPLAETTQFRAVVKSGTCSEVNSDPTTVIVYLTYPFYADNDGDGYGAGPVFMLCSDAANNPPAGYSVNNTDCDDTQADRHETFPFYVDSDGDSYGASGSTAVQLCAIDGNTPPQPNYSVNDLDCNDADATINPSATEVAFDNIDNDCDGSLYNGLPTYYTYMMNNVCGETNQNLNATLNCYDFVLDPYTIAFRFRITNLSTGEVAVLDRSVHHFKLTMTNIYSFGTSFKIEVALIINGEVQPYNPSPCQVTTPPVQTTQLVPSQCGGTLTYIYSNINATPVASTNLYRFRVALASAPTTYYYIERTVPNFNLTQVVGLPLLYNTEYLVAVQIRVKIGNNIAWSQFGAVCSVFTSDPPSSAIVLSQCESTGPTSATQVIGIDPVANASGYRVQLTLFDGLGDLIYSQYIDTATPSFTLSQFTGLLPLTTYTVSVAPIMYGIVTPYGKDCSITTAASSRIIDPTIVTPFSAVAYPNPFAENFKINIKTSSTEMISLQVFDMLGRLIEQREVKLLDIEETTIGDRYPSGVYNVIVKQAEELTTLRVVKR